MRIPLLMLSILLLANLFVDWYIWCAFKLRTRSKALPKIHVILCVILYLFLGVTLCIPRRDGTDAQLLAVMWMLFGYFTIYIPKYFFVLLDFVASIPKFWRHKRMAWLTRLAVCLSVVMFGVMWWAALINRERTRVIEETLWIPDLPASFDGYRIVQFSDLHVGTFGTDTAFVSDLVEEINSLRPDVVFFTGDLVNRRTEEIVPFTRPLSRLRAKDGVISILGNHDYGDYCDWPSQEAKDRNMASLVGHNRKMGWQLLLNDHTWLVRGRDSLAVIGVENIGDPPFKIYGDLEKSYPALNDSFPKILLSHNPAHWSAEVEDNDSVNIALTLAGHTHAMQIEVAGISPAVFRYPKWGGLYWDKDKSSYLYVNIGAGTVGIPMRIGATPEITVITLRRGDGALSNSEAVPLSKPDTAKSQDYTPALPLSDQDTVPVANQKSE